MSRTRTLLLLLVVSALAGAARAESLGRIDFPVTGSPAAQARFQRGVLALHSFFYDEALDEFRAATRAEPGFAMGYWGEAMALNHTLWVAQDTEGGRQALARIDARAELGPKERAFIEAARALYGPGDKEARDQAYADALERTATAYPDDAEVQAFFALALLGTLRDDRPALATRMRAGALALDLLARHPDHPGAAHYAIHAFDDADHAILALPAARRYGAIAPEAFHARHMPAHIFVNLGMWDEAAAACESAWAASVAWAGKRGHGIEKRDYHSLSWLVFIYTQEGRRHKAEEALATFAAAAQASSDAHVDTSYAYTAAAYLERIGQPGRLESALAAVGAAATGAGAAVGVAATGAGAAPGCHETSGTPGAGDPAAQVALALADVRADAAAARGDAAETGRQAALMAAQAKLLASATYGPELAKGAKRDAAARDARLALAGRRFADAAARLREVAALDAQSAFRGSAAPAGLATETRLGEVLLAAGDAAGARAAFADALEVTPADARALLGAARAARAAGDAAGATRLYRRLAAQWAHADADFREADLAEVRAAAK
jgi:hypothetical protein